MRENSNSRLFNGRFADEKEDILRSSGNSRNDGKIK